MFLRKSVFNGLGSICLISYHEHNSWMLVMRVNYRCPCNMLSSSIMFVSIICYQGQPCQLWMRTSIICCQGPPCQLWMRTPISPAVVKCYCYTSYCVARLIPYHVCWHTRCLNQATFRTLWLWHPCIWKHLITNHIHQSFVIQIQTGNQFEDFQHRGLLSCVHTLGIIDFK